VSGEVIEIEYQLTVDDYAKFSADVHFTKMQRRIGMLSFLRTSIFIVLFLLAVIFIVFFVRVFKGELELSGFLNFFIISLFNSVLPFMIFWLFVVFSFFFGTKFGYRKIKAVSKRKLGVGENRSFLAASKLMLAKGGVTQSSEYAKFEFKWAGIEKVEILNNDFCLFVSACSAIIVPSRFFKSEEEKQRIYVQCLKWWQAAQEKSPESEAP
jgi:hypothetical protein